MYDIGSWIGSNITHTNTLKASRFQGFFMVINVITGLDPVICL